MGNLVTVQTQAPALPGLFRSTNQWSSAYKRDNVPSFLGGSMSGKNKQTVEETAGAYKVSKWPTWLGLVVTALYAAFLLAYCVENWCEIVGLVPNTLGDFLAGAFGPIALLWLVCGYFQQGSELQQNTEALRLQYSALQKQVEELTLSRGHQEQLAGATKEQFEFIVAQSKRVAEREEQMYSPNFSVDNLDPYPVESNVLFGCTIKNLGADVTILDVKSSSVLSRSYRGELKTASEFSFDVKVGGGAIPQLVKSSTITISYRDKLGRVGSTDFRFERDDATQRYKLVV
ncbi:TPA: hypothetical protein UM358_000437 [Stenotrophomonas maltophilia]|nr:hypothetical protein [Stenotrophomonas maltophilia]HEL4204011.1 hypothetical protein [Stenotrophomonas maltophilia]